MKKYDHEFLFNEKQLQAYTKTLKNPKVNSDAMLYEVMKDKTSGIITRKRSEKKYSKCTEF